MPYFPCTNNVFLCTMPLPPQTKIKFLKVHPLIETSKRVLETFHSPTWIKTNKNTTEKQYRLDYCRYIFGWNIKRELLLQYPSTIPALGAPCPGGGGGGYSAGFQAMGMIKWEQNSKPQKNPLTKKKTKNSQMEFPSLNIFQKTDITQKIPKKIPT